MPNKHNSLHDLFDDIADAIRLKDGSSAEISADDFPDRIEAISSSNEESITINSLSVNDNGTYTAPEGTAYNPVIVNVTVEGDGNNISY